jgi:hypothetical protein
MRAEFMINGILTDCCFGVSVEECCGDALEEAEQYLFELWRGVLNLLRCSSLRFCCVSLKIFDRVCLYVLHVEMELEW